MSRVILDVRKPRTSNDDAILDVVFDHDPARPSQEWVRITRRYPGEGNSEDEVAMTRREFEWLCGLLEQAGWGP